MEEKRVSLSVFLKRGGGGLNFLRIFPGMGTGFVLGAGVGFILGAGMGFALGKGTDSVFGAEMGFVLCAYSVTTA